MRKGWAWKPVNALLIEFEDTDLIGTIRCFVECAPAPKFTELEAESASRIHGFSEASSTHSRFEFCIQGASSKSENLASFKRLKKELADANLVSANKAVICSKKAIRQVLTVRCGSK